MALAPKVDAINNSRTKPVMRDARVSKETIEADLISDTAQSVAPQKCRSLRVGNDGPCFYNHRMAIPQSFLQELLARADVVEIVGRYVQLKKGGANFMGLCPFHG